MNLLLYPIVLPLLAGVICLLIPRRAKGLAEGTSLIASIISFIVAINIFRGRNLSFFRKWFDYGINFDLRAFALSNFILVAICLFGILIVLYSFKFMQGKPRLNEYYAYILWTIGGACGAVLSNDLVIFAVFWGFLAITLYLLIGIEKMESTPAAKKTMVIIGGSDALILLGIAIIWYLTSSFAMDKIRIPLNGVWPILAFLSLAVGAFAKAGAMPFHTWIPDCAERAPIPVTAFLPASLDKLLGIYLLARISLHLFELKMATAMSVVLLIVGAVTVIAAVMMALVQHDLKRLLSYHAVSQVGYMVLGIGTANPIGIAGGIFHMLNHAIYKGCLFLCGGAVEHRAKTTNLDSLGGLAKAMPITFLTCLIAALSISGIPPFNGFVSKWMVYQGIIELGKGGDKLWIIWLVAAMFGSALTLASFMKVIHATFLGQPSTVNRQRPNKIKEVNFTMWVPMVVLAGLCVIFGVFAHTIPLKHLILPSIVNIPAKEAWLGWWSPGLATLLIIIGIVIGGIIYWMGNLKKGLREDTSFIGGEIIPVEHRITGVDFYDTIRDLGLLKGIYKMAGKGLFDIYHYGACAVISITKRKIGKKIFERCIDIYHLGANIVALFTKAVQRVHTGLLTAYFSWFLAGLLILIYILMKVIKSLPR